MKRKLFSLVMTVFLLSQFLLPAYASETAVPAAKIYAAYWKKGMLYTFVQLNQTEAENQSVSLLINNHQICETNPAKTTDTDAVIHYMLLIDTSTSMARYKNSILSFAQKLMETEQNIKISIARFDRTFEVVDAELTSWEAVKASLQSLTFYKDGSNINGSAAAAIEYLGSDGYPGGEMTNLVVITDGDPWYTNNWKQEKEFESEANQNLAILMEAYPEIIVHTLSFAKWEENTYAPLSAGKGLHFAEGSAEDAGTALAEFTDSLYTVFFPVKGYDESAEILDTLTMRIGTNFVSYGTVRNADVAPQVNVDTSQDDIPEESSEPDESTAPETTESTEPEVPASEAETGPIATEERIASSESEPPAVATNETENSSAMVYVICGIAILILLVILVVLAAKKRQSRKNSVRMRIEVLAGNNIHVKDAYYLTNELLIGGCKKCDVIIPNSSNSVIARITKQDQIIYIKDEGISDDVRLNGMRIFAPNRLRSGDRVSIGAVTLRFLF